ESFNNIGYVCMLNGQYDSADIYFRKAIKGSPYYYPEAQKNLAALQDLRLQKTVVQKNKPSIAIDEQKQEPLVPSIISAVEHSNTNNKSISESIKSKATEDSTQPNVQTVTEEISKTENIKVEKQITIENSSSVNNVLSEPATDITPPTNTKQKIGTTVLVTEKNELNSIQQELVPSKPSAIEDLDTKGIQLVTEEVQITEPLNSETEINTEHELKKTAPEVLTKEPKVVVESLIENIDTTKTEPLKTPSSSTSAVSSEPRSDVDEQAEKSLPIPENKNIEAVTKSDKNPAQSTESILKSIQDEIEGNSLTPLHLLDTDKNSLSKEESTKDILIKDIPEPSSPLNKVDDSVNQ
ncbi:MAG: hypothetical protein KAR12_06480, partial [Methylococcales bacterium]|nr:hypothetical protein [Methylococcales bacterium]